jgi:hypothetical protein
MQNSKKIETYINPQGSRVHITLERLDLDMLCLGVHNRSHESPKLEPSFDEVWVLGQGIGDPRECLWWSLCAQLSKIVLAGGSARHTKSM